MGEAEKKKLIILTGPTAVGKTELSIKLAQKINGEIISADSIQVYKHLDIGSAKITKDEMKGVPHHLIDVLEPDFDFNVALFQEMALEAMEGIYLRGRIPIIVGGTGFYIQALLNDIDFKENNDDGYRLELQKIYNEKGSGYLYDMLKETDPESALNIHENNVKRVIRALEYYHQTGQKISEHNENERQKESPYSFAYFVLNCNRNKLYERINMRVDLMVKAGLFEEVKNLVEKYHLTSDMVSMQGLGYKEMIDVVNGTSSIDDAVYLIKRDTRHFAKRQLTWFRREREVTWLDKDIYDTEDKQLQFMIDILRSKGII